MLSIKYHRIFDYELVKSDFPKWRYNGDKSITSITGIKSSTRIRREKISQKKLLIAKKAAAVLSKIPTIKFAGITGSLAMLNSNKDSDIDLMIITKNGTLWTTRLVAYLAFSICHLAFRRSFDGNQKDALCLNIWLDENDLTWYKKDRNIYTAHEIAQIVPLVNKDKVYERFLLENKWVLDFWPNAIKIYNLQFTIYNSKPNFIEKMAFNLQKIYMSKKVTRETITPTRALFHPQDWGKFVLERLRS